MLRNWERPEVSIPGADQKDRGLWEREWSSAEIDDIITRAETKNTKENTKWAIRVFEGEFHIRKCHKLIIKVRN